MAEISIKEKLHLAIAEIEDERLLEIKNEYLNMFNERHAKYLSGEEKAYTIEEFRVKSEKEHGL
ncbi:MAG: hypothetical protein ABIP30_11120 [Ferruginibacter sp.]